jgi:hypothetical protein
VIWCYVQDDPVLSIPAQKAAVQPDEVFGPISPPASQDSHPSSEKEVVEIVLTASPVSSQQQPTAAEDEEPLQPTAALDKSFTFVETAALAVAEVRVQYFLTASPIL